MEAYLIPLVLLVSVIGTFGAKIGNTTVEDDYWWGPNTTDEIDTSAKPFQINFTDEMIEDLRSRLMNHRPFTPPLDGVGFSYGFNSNHLGTWINYWASNYSFNERLEFLRQYPQYTMNVQGLNIHYIRVTPQVNTTNVTTLPILMLHGFPGSVREFYEMIPILTECNEDSNFCLELIIPSLPGYGFSDGTTKPGLGMVEVAVVLRNLMRQLQFTRYFVHGGDWGASIGACISTLFPDEVRGFHTNLALSQSTEAYALLFLGAYYPDLVVDPSLADRMYPLTNISKYYMQELGYFHLQAAKPDTVGISLAESPVSLLSYVLQLMSTGTRKAYTYSEDGGLLNHFTMDQLIDNLMYYWAPNSIVTACRLYAESANLRTLGLGVLASKTSVPTWSIHAKDEFIYQPPLLLKLKYTNLVNSTVLNTGGHFLALELPEILSADLLKAIAAFISLETTD